MAGLQRSLLLAVRRIAASAARWKPELVVHVGDYHYRENACPKDNATGADSPLGYGEDAWRADLFEPGAALLAAAPWVVARGNHEACNRAGQGWHRLLEPHPLIAGADCIDAANDFAGNHAEPFAIDLGGGAQLILLDLASIGSEPLPPDDPRRARFMADANLVTGLARQGKTSFLVGHYPLPRSARRRVAAPASATPRLRRPSATGPAFQRWPASPPYYRAMSTSSNRSALAARCRARS